MTSDSSSATVADLDFMVGEWHGEGFVMVWNQPRWGMMFGHMQAEEDGVTNYWETFRYSDTPGGVVFEPTQMGKEQGTWPIAELSRDGAGGTVVFENPGVPLRRRLTFHVSSDGSTLEPSVDGTSDGAPHRQHWVLRRR